MSQGNFPERADRLAQIAGGLALGQDFPLFKSAPLPPASFKKLRDVVNLYIFTTLSGFFGDQDITLSDDIFTEQAELIRQLPNRTPNGLLLPKKQTYLAYNMVHAAVAEIFTQCGFSAHVDRIHSPINIRVVDGEYDPKVDLRPRASAKWHLDLWSGEPAGAIMFFLPVLGDTKNVAVRWIEPTEVPPALLRPLADFDEGKALIDGGQEYDLAFEPGNVALSDPFLVHATQKTTRALRLSIDFRFVAADICPGDAEAPGTRDVNYIDFADWDDIGRGRILSTSAPLEPFTEADDRAK
ncbi:MAG: hypothetical protein QGF09_05535, partial [Rhodospirillales bacterium]|nr:hypothetical protein [Rhodospirillales bacterium]